MTEKEDKDDNRLNKALKKLSKLNINPSRQTKVESNFPVFASNNLITTSELYYPFNLPSLEAFAEEEKSKSSSVKQKRTRTRKRKSEASEEEKMNVKLKSARNKLQNLTITVKNDAASVKSVSPRKETKKEKKETKDPQVNPLLQRLAQLQKGKITSEQLLKTNPLPKSKKVVVNKDDEVKKNKEEVQRLNLKIQEKISQNIKPKLLTIINQPVNGLNNRTTSESFTPRLLKKQTRPVPVKKTLVKLPNDETVEIHRYTKEDLQQLQSTATWQRVPRLLELKICATPLSPHEIFILKLLNVKNDEERQKLIIDAAVEQKFIKRLDANDFEFLKVEVEEPTEVPKTIDKIMDKKLDDKKLMEIERIKLMAKNNEELNEMMYRYEFLNLFENVLDEEVKQKPVPEIVQHLIEKKQAHMIEGEIRVNAKNNQEAYVGHPKATKDVCVSKLILRKHSFHGDFVKVLVKENDGEKFETSIDDELDVSEIQPASISGRNFGCVIEITEKRHSRRVIGSLSSFTNDKKKHIMFNVRDMKVPNIRLGRDGIPHNIELSDKMLMVVEITSWNHDQPKGKIVEIIGVKGEFKAENVAILQQHNLNPQPYAQHIIEQLPTEPFTIPPEEFKYREDLRKKCIFSIDPETARDLDDALSCESLPNGNLLIGVHISDVSYFLKENSELDEIVKDKATSIYLVDTVYHMLPVQLCLLCSLLPGADKMAYSVFWEMNPDTAEIYNTRFTRSVVNSCAKLSYDHAQSVIDGTSVVLPEIHNGFTAEEVCDVILKLQKLAVVMRENRKAKGALKIDQPKIAFKFDKDDNRMEVPVDFFKYPIKDSNRLIEEFMLLANISVAKFIYEKFPEISLLRHHQPPNAGALKKLVKVLSKHGIEIDVSSSSTISSSMERLTKTAGMNAALNLMVSKTMTRAKYFCSDNAEDESEFWHFALSIPMYTHFTSPIRRYADVLVHRVLNAALGYEEPPARTPEEIQKLAEISNVQKYAAKLAGDDSSNLYFVQFIRSLKSKTMMASVLGIFEFNLEVVLIETGHVLKVYYKNLEQSDEVIIKTFAEDSPPYATFVLRKNKSSPMKIVFGSEILVKLEVFKEKLIVNQIFYHN